MCPSSPHAHVGAPTWRLLIPNDHLASPPRHEMGGVTMEKSPRLPGRVTSDTTGKARKTRREAEQGGWGFQNPNNVLEPKW